MMLVASKKPEFAAYSWAISITVLASAITLTSIGIRANST